MRRRVKKEGFIEIFDEVIHLPDLTVYGDVDELQAPIGFLHPEDFRRVRKNAQARARRAASRKPKNK